VKRSSHRGDARSRGPAKPRKTFQEIAAGYKRFDPETEGYGSPQEWNAAFFERMGFEEAQRVVSKQNRSPRQILGVGARATWPEIVKAYRVKVLANHPDRIASTGMSFGQASEATKHINAAYAVLAREFGK
jgi:hypothetical protein